MTSAVQIDAKPIDAKPKGEPENPAQLATYIFEHTAHESSDPGGNISAGDTCVLTVVVDISEGSGTYRITSGSIVFEQGYTITIYGGDFRVYNNEYYGYDDDYYGDAIQLENLSCSRPDLSGRALDAGSPYIYCYADTRDWLSSSDAPRTIPSVMFPNWDFWWGDRATRVRVYDHGGFDKVTVIWPESDDVAEEPEDEPEPDIGQSSSYVTGLTRRVHLYAQKLFAGVTDE